MLEVDKKIFVLGHKNPDTDALCSAIAYADFLKKKGKEAEAVRTGNLNEETKFALNYFGVKIPPPLKNIANKKVILLDHNEKEQSLEGIEKAEILEVIDHHKISFSFEKPIYFLTKPVGSTCTIVAEKFLKEKVKLEPKIAGILLCGILSDTVAFRSPTTTEKDKEISQKLAKIAKIKNLDQFGIQLKKKKATLKGMTISEILNSDVKDFDFSGKKVRISQVEICDLKEIKDRKSKLISEMEKILKKENLDLFLLMGTDIIKIGTEILAVGNEKKLENAFKKKLKENSFYLPKVMSRKKEIVPPLMKVYRAR